MKLQATLFAASVFTAIASRAEMAWPSVALSNPVLRMTAHLPGAAESFYRGSRFARCSLLDGVAAGGVPFYVRHYDGAHEPERHDAVCGPAEEFDLNTPPPGYADSADGCFIKIGVGVLRRPADETEYAFHKNYEVLDPGFWTHEAHGEREVVFHHRAALPDGSHGVEYTHRVSLDEAEATFQITRTLKNTGRKKFTTRHYNHQFIRVNDTDIGPGYSLELPFAPRFVEAQAEPRAVETRGKGIALAAPLAGTFWSPVAGFGKETENVFTLRNGGSALRCATDLPIADFVVYATPRVICPEVFVELTLAPGEEKTWTTTFAFETPQ